MSKIQQPSDDIAVGNVWRGREILDVRDLDRDGYLLYKAEGRKDADGDFVVKLVTPEHPYGVAVQHAHFAIDLYGKLQQSPEDAVTVLRGIWGVWKGEDVDDVIDGVESDSGDMCGYSADYIIQTYDWILDQEDINYTSERSEEKQEDIDELFETAGIPKVSGREGSEITITLLIDIILGEHPVEALRKTGLKVQSYGGGL